MPQCESAVDTWTYDSDVSANKAPYLLTCILDKATEK